MALGNNSQSASRIFLSVGFGKLRQKSLANGQKVEETTPGAVKRKTQQGADTFALEYSNITGTIESISYKDNSGTEFQSSFEVVIKDDKLYQISFPDDSKYWFAFMELLPNVVMTEPITLSVFDYVNKEKKRKSGLNVEQFNNTNTREVDFKDNQPHNFVNSYYKEYTKDGNWVFHHGYPVPPKDINWMDKDDVKIYFMGVKKFLKAEFSRIFADGLVNKNQHVKEHINTTELESENNAPLPGEDDLPW